MRAVKNIFAQFIDSILFLNVCDKHVIKVCDKLIFQVGIVEFFYYKVKFDFYP